MKKRPFLLPLAALAAALTSGQSSASAPVLPAIDDQGGDQNRLVVPQADSEVVTAASGDNLFSFVLKRGEGGQMMAYHSSHSSHASHASHASHSSHYSGS